jgi:hypothetical protein
LFLIISQLAPLVLPPRVHVRIRSAGSPNIMQLTRLCPQKPLDKIQ